MEKDADVVAVTAKVDAVTDVMTEAIADADIATNPAEIQRHYKKIYIKRKYGTLSEFRISFLYICKMKKIMKEKIIIYIPPSS